MNIKYILLKSSQELTQFLFSTAFLNCLKLEVNTIEENKNAIAYEKINIREGEVAIRVWLNYLEEFDILDFDIIENIRKRIKIHNEVHIDTYIPTCLDIKTSVKEVSKYDRLHYLLYRFYIETTARTTEVKHFFENFDEKNIEIHENGIVTYNNFYLRGHKSSYYLFFTLELYSTMKIFSNKVGEYYSFLVYINLVLSQETFVVHYI